MTDVCVHAFSVIPFTGVVKHGVWEQEVSDKLSALGFQARPAEKGERLLAQAAPRIFDRHADGWRITADAGEDGRLVAVLAREHEQAPLESWSPIDTLVRRRSHHLELTKGTHELSDRLARMCDAFGLPTQSPPYTFTFYALQLSCDVHAATERLQDDAALRMKVSLLLDPSLCLVEDSEICSGLRELDWSDPEIWNRLPPVDESLLVDIERGLDLQAYASWGSLVLVGADAAARASDYEYLERRLQRRWLQTYEAIEDIEQRLRSARGLAPLVELRTATRNALDDTAHVRDMSISSRHLAILNAIIRTSRLTELADQLESRAETVREQVSEEVDRRQLSSDLKLQTILLFLAAVQVAGLVVTENWLPDLIAMFGVAITTVAGYAVLRQR